MCIADSFVPDIWWDDTMHAVVLISRTSHAPHPTASTPYAVYRRFQQALHTSFGRVWYWWTCEPRTISLILVAVYADRPLAKSIG